MSKNLPVPFVAATLLYCLASLGHFAHNSEFICEYPNLPASFTQAKICLAWLAITSVGVAGFVLMLLPRTAWRVPGLLLVAAYAALGFDGLAHYALAPFAFHTPGANATILAEVAAAAVLLSATAYLLAADFLRHRRVVA